MSSTWVFLSLSCKCSACVEVTLAYCDYSCKLFYNTAVWSVSYVIKLFCVSLTFWHGKKVSLTLHIHPSTIFTSELGT